MPWWKRTEKHETNRYKRGEHVMSKPEAQVMRRIQSETGKTEEEVRKIKKYRKMLSDSQMSKAARETERYRREFHAKHQEKWSWGSEKAMFKQKTMQVLNGDKEMTAELYKRYAGGLVDDKRPKAFFYRGISRLANETAVMQAIAQTEGQFVYSPDRNEVGFMYETSMTVFSLCYREAK